ncbi:MAG: hypothetical protein PHW31_02500 [Candidatus Pacebacteria bacterium]|nr:hypothetical protein [Candidatus Paceibacterota bacterium]
MPQISSPQKIWKNWGFVEEKIDKEAQWLYQNIPTFLREENNAPRGCNDCIKRCSPQIPQRQRIKRIITLLSLFHLITKGVIRTYKTDYAFPLFNVLSIN